MLTADACGVRGEISKQKLIDAGYKGPIEIIHNPMKLQITESQNHRITEYDLISVADFAEEKNFPWMMQVLYGLKKTISSFKIVLCGRGLKENLQKYVEQYDLNDNVDFKGFVEPEELEPLYRNSKCFLLTSAFEGLPQAAIEAISFGLPGILTDVGECSWLIRNDMDGFVIPHNNTEKMVDVLYNLLSDPAKIEIFGKQAKSRYESLSHEFEVTNIAQNWKSLFDGVLKRNVE